MYVCMCVCHIMEFFTNIVLNTINKQWRNHIVHGKEIKLSFQVLRISCKHSFTSFTLFGLIITDVRFCIQCMCIGTLAHAHTYTQLRTTEYAYKNFVI